MVIIGFKFKNQKARWVQEPPLGVEKTQRAKQYLYLKGAWVIPSITGILCEYTPEHRTE